MKKPPLENVRMMVVDDTEIFREFVVDMMEFFLNRKVVSFENGRDAWEYLQENEFDIIISDIDMPQMNGLELLEKVRSNFPDITFICMSADSGHIPEATRLGADHFLTKPVPLDRFVRITKKYITGEES